MSDQFEWHIADEEEDDGSLPRPKPNRGPRLPIYSVWIVAVIVIIGGLFAARQIINQNDESAEALVTAVQELLDLEHEAYLAGNGPLFLSAFSDDIGWQVAQLLPYNQEKARAGLRVTHAEQFNNSIRADVTWEVDGTARQAVAFFRQQNAQIVHTPPPGDFWGLQQQESYSWGNLTFYEADWDWQREIGNFVNTVVSRTCAETCNEDKLPFRVMVRDDYRDTPLAGEIYVPSPQLMILDEDGRPAAIFWDLLEQKVTAHLTSAVIRFGIPPAGTLPAIQYQEAADAFMQMHPDIIIELLPLDSHTPHPNQLAGLDGAALQLTEELITNGLVYDLTDFALEDGDLLPTDFYEQIWLSSFWYERMWQVPHVAEMDLLFYDRMGYQAAGQSEPTLRWTWEEMAEDMAAVVNAVADSDLEWGYLDVTRNTLFSSAYNWKNECMEEATVRCERRLEPQTVAAALDWYRQMVISGQTPDVTQLNAEELQSLLLNNQSARRHALIWVERPVQYEYHLLLDAIGVLPFPGSDRFDGITPLWVRGNIITQHSERPLAVWEWIKFLSHQPPVQHLRLIPARPSVAGSIGYWAKLPLPLGNAMRTAFPFARPVLIEEQAYFSPEQVAAVVSSEMTAEEAARQWPQVRWFDGALGP
jgi:hypothetical protein